MLFVVETRSINLLSGVTSLALGLVKIDKSDYMCFTIDNKKNDIAQKDEMKANGTRLYPTRLRHIIEKHKKVFFEITLEDKKLYRNNSYRPVLSTCSPERKTNSLTFPNQEHTRLENEIIIDYVTGEPTP